MNELKMNIPWNDLYKDEHCTKHEYDVSDFTKVQLQETVYILQNKVDQHESNIK